MLLGAERPRVEVRPDAVDTLGPEVAELAARAGIPPEPWQGDGIDIMMSLRADGLWAARHYVEIVGRQQGKSGGIGVPRVLAGLFLLPERLLMWSAHEYKTAIESFLLVREALLNLGEEVKPNLIEIPTGDDVIHVKVNNTNGEEGFETSGAVGRKRLRFLARSKGSGRGFTGDVNIIDEAFAYTPAQQAALAPTALARPYAQTIYLSSPPLDGRTGQVLYKLAQRAAAGDPRVGLRDWGLAMMLDEFARLSAADRKAFLRNPAHWAATLPALGRGRVTEEAVADLINEFADDRDAAREVLCMWPRQITDGIGWQVITEAAWGARGGAAGPPTGRVMFAVAASWPNAELGSIGVAGRHGGEVLVQITESTTGVLDHRPGTGWIVDRVRELRDAHKPMGVVLDRKGPARHLIPDFEDAGIDLIHPTTDEVGQAAALFFDAFAGDRPTGRHYDQAELNASVEAAGKRDVGEGWTWQRRVGDISPLEAVTFALWGVLARNRTPPPPPLAVPSGEARSETADLMNAQF